MNNSEKNIHVKTLIVDDNEDFRLLLKEQLKTIFPSLVVEEAAEGNEALRKVDTFQPKLIFMDIKMPGENGLKITEKIKARYHDIIVIIVTNYDIPEYREAALQSGASDFLPKGSLSFAQLEDIVKSTTNSL